MVAPDGPEFIKAWTKMTGGVLGEFADNASVLRQFYNMTDDMIDNIVYEMKHANRGAGVRSRIKQNPSDIDNIMRPWLEDPAFAYATRDNTNISWLDWKKSIFAKHFFGIGKKFETMCTIGLSEIGSSTHTFVRDRVLTHIGKDINDYHMFPSVQLKIGNTENYFVADQLFIKYGLNAKSDSAIVDIIVLETKLQTTTNLSARQLEALQNASQGFNVRSLTSKSKYNEKIELTPKSDKLVLPGGASPTFFKLFDNADGNAINDIIKLTP